MGESSDKRGQLVICLALFAASLAVRLTGLAAKPFWAAEIQEFVYAYRGELTQNLVFSAGDFTGFLYHWLCGTAGLSPGSVAVRLLSVLAGSALAPAMFRLLSESGYRYEGLAASIFATFSLPLLQASQEGRFYIGMTLFLSVGFILHLVLPQERRKLPLLAITDSLALLTHPYALVWIGTRWLVTLIPRPAEAVRHLTQRPRLLLSYALPVAMAALLQLSELLVARTRFHDLHSYFTLQPYPPSFGFFPELFGHMGTGSGVQAALWGAAALLGIFFLSDRAFATALRTGLYALVTPLLLTLVIWGMGGRFSFTHVLPASIPIYFLAAVGVLGLLKTGMPRKIAIIVVGTLLLAATLRMALLDRRYHGRPTRLEMGSDISFACGIVSGVSRTMQSLPDGAAVSPGDALITRYDKYFTQLAFYCDDLPPGMSVAVPERPASPWVVGFNHLFVEEGEPYLARDRVVLLDDYLASARAGQTIYVVIPIFEPIEGEFSETLGWYDIPEPYAWPNMEGGVGETGWRLNQGPLVHIYWKTLDGMENKDLLRATIDRLLERSRRWI